MKLSVVIPALDEADRIARTVASARIEGGEIWVVDGGSRDATREVAADAGACIISAPPGRARQLGVGAEASRGDVVLFLHADTLLPTGWDVAVRDALRDPAVAGGAFRLRFDDRRPLLRVLEAGARLRVALFGLPYGDQALFVRRQVLREMGGVPQAPILEDLDLVRGIRQRGRLALLPLPATTSARRYLERGPLRTALRNLCAALAWRAGVDRDRVAAWYGR